MGTRTDKNLKNIIKTLTDKGGIVADERLSAVAMRNDRDVTDIDCADLCDFIKLTVRSGYTCIVYPAGDRIMLTVQ